MSSITKIKVADTTYDIKDNVSGYITKDVDNLTNYYDKEQVDFNIEQVSDEIPTRTSQLTNDSGFIGTAALAGKQDTLVSGTNIKTINGANILGSGNLVVESQGEINLVDDVQLNGTSIVTNKVANIHVVDNYGNNNPLTTQQNLQDVHDELDAKLPYTMLDFNETTNHIKTVEGTDLPIAYTRVDGNSKQETTTGKNKFNLETNTKATITTDDDINYTYIPLQNENDYLIPCETNTAYTFSVDLSTNVGSDIYIYFLYTDGTNQSAGFLTGSGVLSKSIEKTSNAEKTLKGISVRAYNISTYNNYLFTKPMLEKGSSKTEYEPYTGGQPSPSPDNPQEIEVIEDSIDFKVTGKNLFDKTSTFTKPYDYWVLPINLKQNTTYTLSAMLKGTKLTNVTFAIVPSGDRYSDFSGTMKAVIDYGTGNNSTKTITTDSSWASPKLVIYASSQAIINSIYDNYDIQLEQGTTSTPYEPYKETIIPINLQGNFIGKVGTTKDLLRYQDGHLYLDKKIGKVVLDGSEESWLENAATKGLFQITLTNVSANTSKVCTMSNNLIGVTGLNIAQQSAYVNDSVATYNTNRIFFRLNEYANNLAGLKTWLSTHNTIVYYELATPYTVNLGNIGPIDMFVGTNNILVLTNIDTNYNMRIYNKSGLIPTLTSQLINDSGFVTQSGLGDYALASEVAHTMTMEVNTDYVLTSRLKNKNGSIINTTTVDLPIEGLVMNGRYDTATKKVVLTLKNGNTIEFSIADLISDRQPLIDSTHKLDSDLINTTGQTNQFVLASDKTNWNGKQDGLVSGVNIKTINNISLLGSGNINIQGGGGGGGSTTHHNELDNLDYENSGHTGFQPAGNYALATNVLGLDNTQSYTPTSTYHPATKKYVDDKPTILYGTSTPTSSQGKNGDIYLKYTA